jgi:hypothetical protein
VTRTTDSTTYGMCRLCGKVTPERTFHADVETDVERHLTRGHGCLT